MKPVVVTAATVYPVTIDDVAEHCRCDAGTEATYLDALIVRATRYAENYLGRRFLKTELRVNWDEFPAEIRPPEPPWKSIKHLKYYDCDGVLKTLASTATSTAVIIDADSEPARIQPAYSTVWPATRQIPNAVQLTYYAGYSTAPSAVPATIKHGILMLCGHLYENREAMTDAPLVDVPMGVKALLDCEHYGRLYDGA